VRAIRHGSPPVLHLPDAIAVARPYAGPEPDASPQPYTSAHGDSDPDAC